MAEPKFPELPVEVQVALINAAKDITVAKINIRGQKFDAYTRPRNWFAETMTEVYKGFVDADKSR